MASFSKTVQAVTDAKDTVMSHAPTLPALPTLPGLSSSNNSTFTVKVITCAAAAALLSPPFDCFGVFFSFVA